jgi:hypothetical protein
MKAPSKFAKRVVLLSALALSTVALPARAALIITGGETATRTLTRSAAVLPTITSCAGVEQNLLVRGTAFTGPTGTPTWNFLGNVGLVCSNPLNTTRFAMERTGQTLNLSPANQTVSTTLTAAAPVSYLNWKLEMTCQGSDGAGVRMTSTVTFTGLVS